MSSFRENALKEYFKSHMDKDEPHYLRLEESISIFLRRYFDVSNVSKTIENAVYEMGLKTTVTGRILDMQKAFVYYQIDVDQIAILQEPDVHKRFPGLIHYVGEL